MAAVAFICLFSFNDREEKSGHHLISLGKLII